jgi:hypothetical protein
MFKFLTVKEAFAKSRKKEMLNYLYNKIFHFHENLSDTIVIPTELIKKNGKFLPYFSLLSAFLLDCNPKNFTFTENEGLSVFCPVSRKETDLVEETMAKFNADVDELEMHKEYNFKQKNLSNFDGDFVIRDAFLEGRSACRNELNVMWWITQKDQHWFKSKLLIDCIQTLKPFNCWFKFCSQNRQIKVPTKQQVENELNKQKGGAKTSDVVQENQEKSVEEQNLEILKDGEEIPNIKITLEPTFRQDQTKETRTKTKREREIRKRTAKKTKNDKTQTNCP